MSPSSGSTAAAKQTVTISVTPADSLETVKAKLTAAGAAAPDELFFGGKPLTGTLGECGLEEEASIDALIQS